VFKVSENEQPCLGEGCYLELDKIEKLLNDPDLRHHLGVETAGNFSTGNDTVGAHFRSNLDKWRVHTEEYIVGLLERGIRVLIYAGTYDWQCNWVMNYQMVQSLEWSRSEEFRKTEMRNWTVDGKVVGKTKSTGNLTFATIFGAGHMVCYKFVRVFLC
jgi:carboxypeptidase C (cathepsin A)